MNPVGSADSRLREACRVVIVNWNSGARLGRCLQSIPDQFEVVVVDNASADLAAGELPASALLLRNEANEGFAAAANRGARGATREFLLFLNPDVEFAAPDSADSMLSLLCARSAIAVATGRLLTTKPEQQGSRTRGKPLILPLPTLASALADILFLEELLGSPPQPDGRAACRIEQAPGACLLIRRSLFEAVGGFDPLFYPAWFEDVDLCKRLAGLGWEVWFQPRSLFRHEGGYSAGRLGQTEFNRIFYRNMVQYFRKHHGGGAAAVVRMAAVLGNVARRLR